MSLTFCNRETKPNSFIIKNFVLAKGDLTVMCFFFATLLFSLAITLSSSSLAEFSSYGLILVFTMTSCASVLCFS